MRNRLLGLLGLGLLTGLATGCTCCHRPEPVARPGGCVPVAAPVPAPPPIIAAPGGPAPALPPPSPPPVVPAIPPSGGAIRNYGPAVDVPEVRLSAPESGTSVEPPLAQLLPPIGAAPQAAVKESPSVEGTPSPSLPVGISQFAYALEGKIAVGLKPHLDGLDWLQSNGFRTVLHVKAPGEEDVADRRLVEKHGMKYVTLEVSPQALNRQVVEAFGRLLAEGDAQPFFIYDRDGMMTGSLWYLHFRTKEEIGDEEARTRAARLGLKTEPEGDQKAMWLAIQKFLSQQP